MSDRKPVMTLRRATNEGSFCTVEVYLLNAGEHFDRFGGSSRGLTVRKTASLITRTTQSMGKHDVEWDLASPKAWAWIRALLTHHGFECEATDEKENEE